MKHFVILSLSLVAMTFAEGFHNGTGFFVNSEYIVTAYHVIDDYSYYRMTGTLQLGMSGGPNFTTDGRIGGMSKSISTMERNTSNLVKSTEVVRLLRENGVQEYPNTRNVKKCVISIVNSIEEFKSAHLTWGV